MDAGFWAAERRRLGHGTGTALDDYLRSEFGRSDRTAALARMVASGTGPALDGRNELTTAPVRRAAFSPLGQRPSSG